MASEILEVRGAELDLVGKVEYMSAGGSVKDRIAKAMVEAAEKEGKLIPGKSVVIEPTSGNTGQKHRYISAHHAADSSISGIGLAMACAIKEKEATLRALGAEVVRTPTEAAWDSPESHIGVASKLQREIPNGIILDQYRNVRRPELLKTPSNLTLLVQVNNPLAHEFTTGPEIIEAIVSTPSTSDRLSSGKVDAFVAGAGTGGTVSGVSSALKKSHNPKCVVVGVDPVSLCLEIYASFSLTSVQKGSVLALPASLNTADDGAMYVVEGIGYDFVPDVLSRAPGAIDTWIKTSDDEAWTAVRRLMRTEGLLVGGSSGSSLGGALSWFKTEQGRAIGATEGANVVVLLPDGIRNYMSKPWFLEMTMEAKPSALANTIAKVLDSSSATKSVEVSTGVKSIQSSL
ncbi:hypothetical protein HWV62_32467 [Athelia sp. TMB]|nr:hypothetical protein HWV62_32467 [Athelia sp. TMB]